MDLVRDLLDKQLVDRRGRRIGRADGVVLELRAGRPPRVAWIETGVTTLAARLDPRLARVLARVLARAGDAYARPVRVSLDRLRDLGVDVALDVDARDSGHLRWERWWREHVIARIPGASR